MADPDDGGGRVPGAAADSRGPVRAGAIVVHHKLGHRWGLDVADGDGDGGGGVAVVRDGGLAAAAAEISPRRDAVDPAKFAASAEAPGGETKGLETNFDR